MTRHTLARPADGRDMQRRRLLALGVLGLVVACRGAASEAPPTEPPEFSVAAAEPVPPMALQACPRPADGLAVESFDGGRGSPVVLARTHDATIALVADADTHKLHTVDVSTMRELAVTSLSGAPSQVMVTWSGRVIVALRDTNQVEMLDFRSSLSEPLSYSCSAEVPIEPVALASSGSSLYVVSRWDAKVTALDLPQGAEGFVTRSEVSVERDPTAIAIAKGSAWVLHAIGARLDRIPLERFTPESRASVRSWMPAAVDGRLVDREAQGPNAKPAPGLRTATQGFALATTLEGQVLAPVVLADSSPAVPPDPSISDLGGGYGSAVANMVGEIAFVPPGGELSSTMGSSPRGIDDCILPRAAAFSRKQSLLLVACAGNDTLVTYEEPKNKAEKVVHSVARVGRGPAGIALDDVGARAYVWSAFDGVLTAVLLGGERVPVLGQAPPAFVDPVLGEQPMVGAVTLRRASVLDPQLELGRRLFHASSRRISSDGRACASCHPDGRDDGVTWKTPDGPRQTPMLVGRIEGTAPYGWNGDLPLEGHFGRTISRLGGHGLEPQHRDAIFAWVKSLEPPAGGASAGFQIERGREVFASAAAGCGGCHPGELTTDAMSHDVHSGKRKGDAREFETPSLRFIGKSAPYYHDGRFSSLEELLQGADDDMGHTAHLEESDRLALLAFLRTL